MVGFPVWLLEFAPMQTSSPSPGAVWFTMTLPKAAKGQGDDSCASAAFACRIQYARVLNGTELMDRCGSAITS